MAKTTRGHRKANREAEKIDRKTKAVLRRVLRSRIRRGIGEYHIALQVWNKSRPNSSVLSPLRARKRENQDAFLRRAAKHYEARLNQMIEYVSAEVEPIIMDSYDISIEVEAIMSGRKRP